MGLFAHQHRGGLGAPALGTHAMTAWKQHLPPMATLGPLLALLAACAFFSFQSDRFLSAGNFSLILQQVSHGIAVRMAVMAMILAPDSLGNSHKTGKRRSA